MKSKSVLAGVAIFLAMCCIAAQTFTIKLYTDFPNSTPVSSDFLLFQRGGNFISSAQSQFLPVWFNNPVFTGNGSINGTFNIGSTLTVGGAVITGVTFYGDGSGLSNVATQVYMKNINDNGTNETFWDSTFNGVSTFQEIDAESLYGTNLFTFFTNAPFLKTDGDGKLVAGVTLEGTNVLLSAGANITFTTNGDGTIVIAGNGTNVVDTSTNNLIVVTNIIVYSNVTVLGNTYISTNFSTNFYSSISYITNLYSVTSIITNLYVSQGFITNLYASTNFSTNLYFVSGKGNTLIITNLYVAEQGVLVNSNTAINSAVITDDKHAYTNAANAHGVFTNSATGPPSFGLLQNTEMQNSAITVQNASVSLGGSTLAQGSKPVFDLQSSTNLLLASVSSPTNGVSTASSIDFTVPEAVTNIAGAVSQTSLANFNQTNINHAIRYYVNRTGSDQTITVGSWETDSGRTSATTYTCTNNTTLALMFSAYIGQFTNVTSYKTFR